MTIKMPEDDPKSNLIGFPIGKRKGTLEPVRKKYDACKHEAVFVEDGIREVTCQKCGVVLDAFTVLFELAWKQRRWLEELDAWDALRESRLSDRYDAQWERDHALEADTAARLAHIEQLAKSNRRNYWAEKRFKK